MIVEDDELIRDLTKLMLEDKGYRVLVAKDGQDAMRQSDRFAEVIDLVLSDVILPGQSGTQVARALRRVRPETRQLFMSAHARDRLVDGGIVFAPERLLQKPFTAKELLAAVHDALTAEKA